MTKRLETALRPDLFDPEGASLCRRVRDYFGWKIGEARVINMLTLETGLSDEELEGARAGIFTNPVTQVSGFAAGEAGGIFPILTGRSGWDICPGSGTPPEALRSRR